MKILPSLAGLMLALSIATASAPALATQPTNGLLAVFQAEYQYYKCVIEQPGGPAYVISNVWARSATEAANLARSRIPMGHRVNACGIW
ncbi:hypothetical protein [Stenotrophomonas sp.]|uniref:hypothetical protein n=1 Tax=Stenotrophomonas sp. TaxID=69392 RepID=UPI00289C3487|nr:hypothetical protein [Stenotrophomonas sp.]